MAGRVDAASRLCDFRDAVSGLYSERLAPVVQRPFLHFQFSPGVLQHTGCALGERQWSGWKNDGKRCPQRTQAGDTTAQTSSPAHDSGVSPRTGTGGERLRSLGPRSWGILLDRMETESRGRIRRAVPPLTPRSASFLESRYSLLQP